jgi:hypothetical protein
MKWIPDDTGRFARRPYYEPGELDMECERIVTDFLREKHGAVNFPISTDDLTVMIERDTSELDLYADLSKSGEDIDGVTDFYARRKPAVRISRELSTAEAKAPRLRNTLAHEYGHVKFHYFLWDRNFRAENPPDFSKLIARQRRLVAGFRQSAGSKATTTARGPQCRQTRIIEAPADDWMEWQAGYAGAALLMPLTTLKKYVGGGKRGSIGIAEVAGVFDVSEETARARLHKLGLLSGTMGYSPPPVKDNISYTD